MIQPAALALYAALTAPGLPASPPSSLSPVTTAPAAAPARAEESGGAPAAGSDAERPAPEIGEAGPSCVPRNPNELLPLVCSAPAPPPLRIFADVFQDLRHLIHWKNAAILGVAGGMAAGVHDNDPRYTRSLADSAFLRKAAKPGSLIGSVGFELGLSGAFYGIGRLGGNPKVAHIGWDLMRSQIVSQVITQTIKIAVDRERPNGKAHSFPSGHASTTFASASVLHQHYGWKVGLPAYTVASYVALSRLPSNRHYLGDVIFGSALGIVAGRTVTLHERNPPRFTIEPLAAPGGGDGKGIALVFPLGARPGSDRDR